ncbi:MAG: hypothetical protein QOI89_3807 [Solirubrobacteraceae bacterium]|jgi:hypothetical protein|nr:hypothetical protein [Solirubrobacteraceae bacterium]
MGPAPTVTVPSADPRDQRHWLSALRRQDWVREIRADGRANLLTVARLVALHAGWETLESRPTWERLVSHSGVCERTVARWLQELRVRGWLAHLERGSTPAHRPMVLAHMVGNRAAVYGLRIPLTPAEALNRALEQLVMRLAADLADQATATDDTSPIPDRLSAVPAPATPAKPHPTTAPPVEAGLDGSGPAEHSPPLGPADQQQSGAAGQLNGSPTGFSSSFRDRWVGGFSRASAAVDNLGNIPTDPTRSPHRSADPSKGNNQRTALRAGSEANSGPDWELTVPTSGFAGLIAADWLRRRLPVFARCSRKLTRHLCQPYWSAGWCNRDIVHAMDHRPGVFGQATGVLICPARIAAPQAFIASRLTAWRSAEGVILPGHWSSLLADAAATKTARRLVAARHGRAGAALLRPGERALTAQRITEHGRASRPPASTTTRAAARAAFTAAQAHRARAEAGPRRPECPRRASEGSGE